MWVCFCHSCCSAHYVVVVVVSVCFLFFLFIEKNEVCAYLFNRLHQRLCGTLCVRLSIAWAARHLYTQTNATRQRRCECAHAHLSCLSFFPPFFCLVIHQGATWNRDVRLPQICKRNAHCRANLWPTQIFHWRRSFTCMHTYSRSRSHQVCFWRWCMLVSRFFQFTKLFFLALWANNKQQSNQIVLGIEINCMSWACVCVCVCCLIWNWYPLHLNTKQSIT